MLKCDRTSPGLTLGEFFLCFFLDSNLCMLGLLHEIFYLVGMRFLISFIYIFCLYVDGLVLYCG